MLAADAQTFLGIDGARILPLSNTEEHIFELVHTRVGKQKRRVTSRYQGRTRDNCVSLFAEVFKETGSNFV